jgi:hypothetical protein
MTDHDPNEEGRKVTVGREVHGFEVLDLQLVTSKLINKYGGRVGIEICFETRNNHSGSNHAVAEPHADPFIASYQDEGEDTQCEQLKLRADVPHVDEAHLFRIRPVVDHEDCLPPIFSTTIVDVGNEFSEHGSITEKRPDKV